jgi:membrane-associated HD superfamily phosphohydrolase
METKQTAVDWLEDKIINYDLNQGMAQMRKYILQAKQMEKEQIKKAKTIKNNKNKEEKRRKEFSEWFSKAWDASINSPDKHAEDWNY